MHALYMHWWLSDCMSVVLLDAAAGAISFKAFLAVAHLGEIILHGFLRYVRHN